MKILVIDDEPKAVDYLKAGLSEQGWSVDVALDGHEGAYMCREFTYDVIVLDIMLPGMNGFELLNVIRGRSQTPVIMLSARDQVVDRVRGLREGADDYLTKPFAFSELVERLLALTRRSRTQESTLITVGDLTVDLVSRRASRGGVRLDLTSKEFQLLSLLARRRGQILSKTVIAETIWDVNFESNDNVIEAVIRRLRGKLDAPFAEKLLSTVRGMGYVLEEPNRAPNA